MSEQHIYPPPAAAVKNATISGMAAYDALCKEADTDYAGFWARQAREHLRWKKPFTKTLDASGAPFFKWFEDGTLNVSYNCLDVQVERGLGGKTAIIFEADDGSVTRVTYGELLEKVCKAANALRALGVKRATASSSTCRCRSRASWRCRPARASAPRTRWCSAAFPRNRCATASKTPAR